MNALLALVIEIPDWLFDGQFWSGFFTSIGLCFLILLYITSNFNPFGR